MDVECVPPQAGGPDGPDGPAALPEEIAFLQGRHLDRRTLQRAVILAREWRISPEQVLFKTGWLKQSAYYRALAAHLGLNFQRLHPGAPGWPVEERGHSRVPPRASIVPLAETGEGRLIAVAPGGAALRRLLALSRRPDAMRRMRRRLVLTPAHDIANALRAGGDRDMLHFAIQGLLARAPHLSAVNAPSRAQYAAIGALALACIAGAALCWATAIVAVNAASAMIFFLLTVLRAVASAHALGSRPPRHAPARRWRDDELPPYTLLVPLYRETQVLRGLATALARLDYPPAKLDIKLVMEEDDADTLAAARKAGFGRNVQFVRVPAQGPRTKPKALNYALGLARGDYVVVYDAEDRPEPDQLRRALHLFATEPDAECVQARLAIYNGNDNWLTRQFAVEYAALFDALLPMLSADRMPFPLGGTSNHFRTRRLFAMGGWDAFNVTEDADLGYRMARRGLRSVLLDSSTHEQACITLGAWMRQRTRWMKGWMQTWFVHMRDPSALWRELGPGGFLTFQILMAGQVLSALAHPLFVLLLIALYAQGYLLAPASSSLVHALWSLNLFNLTIGYGAALALGLAGIHRRRLWRFAPMVLATMPVYWLLVSAATCRACWQLATQPFMWEKTDHPDMRLTLKRARRRRPAHLKLGKVERAMGIEPTTFSLGS